MYVLSYVVDYSVETMFRIFPEPTKETSYLTRGDIRVVLDMEDFPNPKSLDPYSISYEIRSKIKAEGYRGYLTIWAYADEDTVSDELKIDYIEGGISILEGGGGARLNMMLVDMLSWASLVDEPSNLLILSKNKKMEQDPNFCRLRKALEKKGFNVAFALADTIINLEGGGDLSVSHKERCKCSPSTA